MDKNAIVLSIIFGVREFSALMELSDPSIEPFGKIQIHEISCSHGDFLENED